MGTITISIAPKNEEIKVGRDFIFTSWNGGLRYQASGLGDIFQEDYLKQCFSAAIAMSSKRWQVEYLLNKTLGVEGKIVFMHKPGDKVVVKDLNWYMENRTDKGWVSLGDCVFDDSMSLLCGKEVTIAKVFPTYYEIVEDNEINCWTEEMFQ